MFRSPSFPLSCALRTCAARACAICAFALLACSIVSPAPARAGTTGADARGADLLLLEGRHGLSLAAGTLSSVTIRHDVSRGGVRSEARDAGAVASISYRYWARQDWNLGVSINLIDAGATSDVEAGEVVSESAAVTAVLVGLSYYPPPLALTRDVRPYGSIAVGPFFGSATNSRVETGAAAVETFSESAPGARVGVGVDFFLGSRFRAGVAGGYDFVADFDQQIGSHRNYSGPEVTVSFGVLFGRGRPSAR